MAELAEAIEIVRAELRDDGFDMATLQTATGFAKNNTLLDAKEGFNENDQARKRFEIAARAVFRKYKARLTFRGVRAYRSDHNAIKFIHNSLGGDRKKADTSAIIQKLNAIVSEAIQVREDDHADDKVFDISKINFDVLRREFALSVKPRSDVQDLKATIEAQLARMLMENPLRTDFQERFVEIVKTTIRSKTETQLKLNLKYSFALQLNWRKKSLGMSLRD